MKVPFGVAATSIEQKFQISNVTSSLVPHVAAVASVIYITVDIIMISSVFINGKALLVFSSLW